MKIKHDFLWKSKHNASTCRYRPYTALAGTDCHWAIGIWMPIPLSVRKSCYAKCRHNGIVHRQICSITDCHRISLVINTFIRTKLLCWITYWDGLPWWSLGQFGVKKQANSDSVPNTNLITARIHSLWEGNVFSRVCQSVWEVSPHVVGHMGLPVPLPLVLNRPVQTCSLRDPLALARFRPVQTCSLDTSTPPSLDPGPWTCSKLFTMGIMPLPQDPPRGPVQTCSVGDLPKACWW